MMKAVRQRWMVCALGALAMAALALPMEAAAQPGGFGGHGGGGHGGGFGGHAGAARIGIGGDRGLHGHGGPLPGGYHGYHAYRGGYRGYWGPGVFVGGIGVGFGLGALYDGYGYGYGYGDPAYVAGTPVYGVAQVVPPTVVQQATPVPPSAPDPIFYPRNGQSAAQTEADRRECNRWATTQQDAVNDASVFQRATLACMDGKGYTAR